MSDTTGWRTDRKTGRTTMYVRASRSAEVGASAAGGVLGLSAGTSAGGELYAVELDRDGRPVDLSVVSAGGFDGSRDLPAVVQPVIGRLGALGSGRRTYEVTAHLDLTDRDNLAAARELLGSVVDRAAMPGRAVIASAVLRERIAQHGTVEARILDEATSSWKLSGEIAAELKVGYGREHEERSARLLAAASRGLDGQWLMREDCVASA
jgi:hypothetical protein